MNEEELKALLGEAAFKAMSPEQIQASIGKFSGSAKELADLKKEKEDREKKEKDNQSSLHDKVIEDNKQKDKSKADSKALETALTFTLTAKEQFKKDEAILPKGILDIFEVADKETYDSAIEKANAIKDGVIQSFFSEQANVDLLTASQKSDLADFQKLTKNGREAKSSEVYKNLFEPALESSKRVKKAEELYKTKNGYGGDTDQDQAYKDKMIQMADKKFFGGKK